VEDAGRVLGREFHGGVRGAGGGSADEQRDGEAGARELLGGVDHLIERRRDQTGEADDVHLLLAGDLENLVARHHDAEVDDFVIITGEDDADDVLADVVHVAFDGREEEFSLCTGRLTGRDRAAFFLLHERREVGDGLLHHAGGFHDLGEKHFAGAEEVADHAHAVHQRAFDDGDRSLVFLQRLGGVGFDEDVDAFHHGVLQAGLDGRVAPGIGGGGLRFEI